jgi:hypothetical protein
MPLCGLGREKRLQLSQKYVWYKCFLYNLSEIKKRTIYRSPLNYNSNYAITSSFVPDYRTQVPVTSTTIVLTHNFRAHYKYILFNFLKYVAFKNDHILT